MDKVRDPFVTFEKPVPTAQDEHATDQRFCKFKVMSDRVMVTNRGKTEMRVQKEIALQEQRPQTAIAPAKKADRISADLKHSNVADIYGSLTKASQLQVINNIVE